MRNSLNQRAWMLATIALCLACGESEQAVDPAASNPAPLSRGDATPRPNVLLISVDTLRPDHLSLYGYPRRVSPAIDAFFEQGTVYERAYSAEANTSPSVVTMLTGLYPARHHVRLLFQRIGSETVLLSDRLKAAGYQTAAVVSNIVLTAEAIGLDAHFDFYDDFVDERELNRDIYERRASRTTDAALSWLENHRDPDRPHLLWVHYIDPHSPYRTPAGEEHEDFQHDAPKRISLWRIPEAARLPGVSDGAEYIDRYDEEISYVDRQIGRLLDRYRALGLADAAIVVFTADHGENLIEHDAYFLHGYHVWESIMRVPLVIRRPGGTAERIATPVSLVDLTPTLLDLLGISVPSGLDGVPLQRRTTQDLISLEASGWGDGQHRAVVRGDEKWFGSVDLEGQLKRRWTVDLDDEGREGKRQPWREDEAGEALMSFFENDPDPAGRPRSMQRGIKINAPKVAPGLSPEQLERLKGLGYVE